MSEQRSVAKNFAAVFEKRSRQVESERRAAESPNPQGMNVPSTEIEPTISYHAIEEGNNVISLWEVSADQLRAIAPDSDDARNILAEQSVVLHRGFTSSDAPIKENEEISRLMSSALKTAAVSGRFDPAGLFADSVETQVRQTVLSQLAPQFVIETHGDQPSWMLASDARRSELIRLKDNGELLLAAETVALPTDRLGEMLRRLLREGDRINLADLQSEDLLALATAIEVTAEMNIPGPDPAQVRLLIGRAEFLSDYDILLSRGFFGREKEHDQLLNFLLSDHAALSFSQGWGGLVLTGLGGAGKSTLLAKFARYVFQEKLATVVILDFDRPGIDARDENWLVQEVTRQVGHQYPEIGEQLRKGRHEARKYRQEYIADARQSVFESASDVRSTLSLIFEVRQALAQVGMDQKPLLLILDTFEEVSEEGFAGKIFEWLFKITEELGPVALKVIFSGRMFDHDLETLKGYATAETIDVGELEPDDAEQLLLRSKIPKSLAKRLAQSKVLPRRPLELTLLAKITANLDTAIDELEEQVRQGTEPAGELFAGLVYRRVLRRLGDETVQALAYPGLVLRYVTPRLIQRVLAPALNLPDFTEDETKQILDQLAKYSWLVYRDGDEVWHRKDLRRSTLKAMVANEPDDARRISVAAIKFFEDEGGERNLAEATYHRLMLVKEPEDGDELDLGEIEAANDFIGADSVDLPKPASVLLRFAVEQKVPPQDVEYLPRRHLDSAFDSAGDYLFKSREYGKAVKLYRRLDLHKEGGKISLRKAQPWQSEALFATVSWDELEKLGAFEPLSTARASFRALSAALFPTEIIAPGTISGSALGEVLMTAAERTATNITELSGPDRDMILNRFFMGLILIDHRSPSEIPTEAVRTLLAPLPDVPSSPLSPVLWQRFQFLQRYFGITHREFSPRFSAATICLKQEWTGYALETLDESGVTDDDPAFKLLLEFRAVLAPKDESQPTVRKLLASVDAMTHDAGARRSFVVKLNEFNSAHLPLLFRGPYPEFRDPVRYALLEAFPDRAGKRKLGAIIQVLVEMELEDLAPDVFADAIAVDPEHALESYVELVDRAWALGPLLKFALREVPGSKKLQSVLAAYDRWDEAYKSMINNAPKPEPKASPHIKG